MNRVPCINCISLAICRNIMRDQYERLQREIKNNGMWFITDTLHYINETMIQNTVIARCSLAKDYLISKSGTPILTSIGMPPLPKINQQHLSGLFSYIHLRSYIFYREIQNRYNKILFEKQIDQMKQKAEELRFKSGLQGTSNSGYTLGRLFGK